MNRIFFAALLSLIAASLYSDSPKMNLSSNPLNFEKAESSPVSASLTIIQITL